MCFPIGFRLGLIITLLLLSAGVFSYFHSDVGYGEPLYLDGEIVGYFTYRGDPSNTFVYYPFRVFTWGLLAWGFVAGVYTVLKRAQTTNDNAKEECTV